MNDRTKARLAIAAALVLIAVSILAVIAKPAYAETTDWTVQPSDAQAPRVTVADIHAKLVEIIEQQLEAEREAAAAEQEAAEQAALESAQYSENYYEPTYYGTGYYTPSYVQGDPDGLNSFVGVVDGPNGTIETAYSSNVLYHYRTSEWEPDEFGFYRTSDGYYVVASNEYEEGTVIETSRGEAMVLDGGCAEGYIDFYVNW